MRQVHRVDELLATEVQVRIVFLDACDLVNMLLLLYYSHDYLTLLIIEASYILLEILLGANWKLRLSSH